MLYSFWSFEPITPPMHYGLAFRTYQDDQTFSELRTSFGLAEDTWSSDKVFARWTDVTGFISASESELSQLGMYRTADNILDRTFNETTGMPGLAVELLGSGK